MKWPNEMHALVSIVEVHKTGYYTPPALNEMSLESIMLDMISRRIMG